MTQELSRRGLFSAFRPARADTAPESRVARAAPGCLEEKGVGCRRCPEVCDVEAISFAPIGRGKARPAISDERCVGCGACLGVCPVAALSLVPRAQAALAAGLADMTRGATA